MATLAAFFRRPEAAVLAGARECYTDQPDIYRLRPLPCEDVYFFAKKIDNSRVIRQADPLARRRSWKAVSVSMLAAALAMVLLMPDAMSMMAGYQLHSLERQRDQLARQKAALELQEATLLSPQRLQELAKELQLVDPDPNHVFYLNPATTDAAVALNVPAK